MKRNIEIQELPNSAELELAFVEGGNYQGKAIPNFYLGKYPITNEQFVPFLNEKGNQKEGGIEWVNIEGEYEGVRSGIVHDEDGFTCIPELKKHPMIYVSWNGARAYCQWLSEKIEKNYRLPSESEWEYAAKGGKNINGYKYVGSNKLKEVGWYRENSHEELKAVGMRFPNELKLYDMSGNVWEWCIDQWNITYNGSFQGGRDWGERAEENLRVIRGGAWNSDSSSCLSIERNWRRIDNGSSNLGFRIARY